MSEEQHDPRPSESPRMSRRRVTTAMVATAVFVVVVLGVFALITILRYNT